MKKSIFLSLAICSLLSAICHAQWQPDVRLTNDPAASYTSLNNAWCIGASGNIVHVIWYDGRSNGIQIFYKRSSDEGQSWRADTQLTVRTSNQEYGRFNPAISVSGPAVHLVYYRNWNATTILWYKNSPDGGLSWTPDIMMPAGGIPLASLSSSGLSVHFVWQQFVWQQSAEQMFYRRSTDGGLSWEAYVQLTNDSANYLYSPSVSAFGSFVNVVWCDLNNSEIYYKRSTDGGTSWLSNTRLTNNPANSFYPCVSASGQLVHVLWEDNRDGNYEIYYKHSTDAGSSWGADMRLTNNPDSSYYPSVAAAGSNVHVVWQDYRDGNYEIYYKRSMDGGTNWDADTRLTNAPGASQFASVAVSGTVVHVVWTDNRDGNYEIYYKRNPTGNPTGIININSEIPKEFKLYQNYPNPFNPTTKIIFDIPNVETHSNASLRIYDILGREVTTLVNEELKPGTYEVEWNASNYPSGVYYYKLSAGDASTSLSVTESKKMVLLK